MRKANISDVKESRSDSPNGKYACIDKDLNDALGSDWHSMDLMNRWPFAVEMSRIPAGKAPFPYHSHSAQFEFYVIISGTGSVRHQDGTTEVKPGDFFMFPPGEPHQLIAGPDTDLVYYSVADNPINDHAYYPDSQKHLVRIPKRMILQNSKEVDYYVGEDEKPA